MVPARLRVALQALRELLFHPGAFFADRDAAQALGTAVIVVLVVAVVTTAGLGLVGWTLGQEIDATTTETVQEPWPESHCEQFAEMNHTPEPCTIDEPVTREVDLGAEAWSAFAGLLPLVFVGVPLGVVAHAIGLHAVSWLAGGEGGFGRTLTVAGWATVPTLLQTAVAVGNMLVAIQSQSFATDPDLLMQQVEQLAADFESTWTVAATVVSTIWQAYIWAHGLRWARDHDPEVAYGVAAVVGLVALLFALV